jgi:hypothetical protein
LVCCVMLTLAKVPTSGKTPGILIKRLSPTTLWANVDVGRKSDSTTYTTQSRVHVLASARSRNGMLGKCEGNLRVCRSFPLRLRLWRWNKTVGAQAHSDDEAQATSRNESYKVRQSNQNGGRRNANEAECLYACAAGNILQQYYSDDQRKREPTDSANNHHRAFDVSPHTMSERRPEKRLPWARRISGQQGNRYSLVNSARLWPLKSPVKTALSASTRERSNLRF